MSVFPPVRLPGISMSKALRSLSALSIRQTEPKISKSCFMLQGKPVDTGIAATPDHSFFKHLASTYANNHQTMLDQSVCTRWSHETLSDLLTNLSITGGFSMTASLTELTGTPCTGGCRTSTTSSPTTWRSPWSSAAASTPASMFRYTFRGMFVNIYNDGRYYLNKEWERNRDSMMLYLQQVHRGVKGLVTTQLLEGAQGQVSNYSSALSITGQ